MKRYLRATLLTTIITVLLIAVWPVFAQEPFVQCGNPGQPLCTTCELFQTFHRMVNFAFQFLVLPLVAVAFIIGGILIFTSAGNVTTLSRGKSILWNTFLGLIIAFASWVIVDIIIVTIGTGGVPSPNWYSYPGCGDAPTSPIDAAIGGASETSPETSTEQTPSSGTLSDSQARAILANANINVNASAPQTSLNGIRQSTIDEIIALKNSCPTCQIKITGGTESGHSTNHTNGYKVDLRFDPTSDSKIQSYTYIGATGNGWPMYRAPNGTVYLKEPDHWDVCVGAPKCP